MTNTHDLIDKLAAAAVEHQPVAANADELAAVVKHGTEARLYVWNRHYATRAERVRLDQNLAQSSPEFQVAVKATERVLADELAADNERRARVHAENPDYFKEY
ncbi:MAG: hypothetical protein QHC90_23175 [Shinella sp.]|nr:hypothetical protein [Shinella sp.]